MTKTDTGRAALAVLLVQDVAVIPILAAIPLLAASRGTPAEAIGESRPKRSRRSTTRSTGWIAADHGRRLHRRPACRPLPRPPADALRRPHRRARGLHRLGAGAGRRRRAAHCRCSACRRPWAPSSAACCWPTASIATSSKAISSRSRACCSACSSSRSACRSPSRCCSTEPLRVLALVRRASSASRSRCCSSSPPSSACIWPTGCCWRSC